jgi:hypothetical protein
MHSDVSSNGVDLTSFNIGYVEYGVTDPLLNDAGKLSDCKLALLSSATVLRSLIVFVVSDSQYVMLCTEMSFVPCCNS